MKRILFCLLFISTICSAAPTLNTTIGGGSSGSNGGSATNALIVGPSGSIYDAGNVTNVRAANITGTVSTTLLPGRTVTLEQFGGKGDGKKVSDVLYTNGSSFIYSPSGPFTPLVVGDGIELYLDPSNSTSIQTWITNYINQYTVQVATNLPLNWLVAITNATGANAAAAGTNWGSIRFGSDNTAAMQACCDALTNSGGTIQLGLGTYCFWGPLISRGIYNTPSVVHLHANALVSEPPGSGPIPYPIIIRGVGDFGQQYASADDFGGTKIFLGTLATDTGNTTLQSTCGFDASADVLAANAFGNINLRFELLTFIVPFQSKITPIFASNNGTLIVNNCSFFTDPRPGAIWNGTYWYNPSGYPTMTGNLPIPPRAQCAASNNWCQCAVVYPGSCNACVADANNLIIEGFNCGIRHAENFVANHVEFTACGSDYGYETPCGGVALYNTSHFTSSYYGIVIIGSQQHGIVAVNCGAESSTAALGYVAVCDPTGLANLTWYGNVAEHMQGLPLQNSIISQGDGALNIGGPVASVRNVFASQLGSVPHNSQLVWDMPFITNNYGSPLSIDLPNQECLNWAYADPNEISAWNRVTLLSGSPTAYFTNGLDGPATFYTTGSGADWVCLYAPQLTNAISTQFTMDAIYYSTNASATSANLIDMETSGSTHGEIYIHNTNLISVNVFGTLTTGTNAAVFDGNWHHVATTYDGSRCIIYFDGQAISTNTFSTALTWVTIPDIFGGVNLGGAEGENRIWARCLAPSEIAQLYAQHFVNNGAALKGSFAGTFICVSNSWNLFNATNRAPNFATIFHVSSNGVPTDIYMSNGVPFFYNELGNGNVIIP